MSKKLEYLVIHCSETPEGKDYADGVIGGWHTDPKPKGNGWSKPGYTDIIHLDRIENLTPFDQDDEVDGFEITNGVRGINSISRHICYVGGKTADMKEDKDTRNDYQFEALEIYVKYMVLRHPDIKIAGHNQFTDKKECPAFDVPYFCRQICIPEKNIYNG